MEYILHDLFHLCIQLLQVCTIASELVPQFSNLKESYSYNTRWNRKTYVPNVNIISRSSHLIHKTAMQSHRLRSIGSYIPKRITKKNKKISRDQIAIRVWFSSSTMAFIFFSRDLISASRRLNSLLNSDSSIFFLFENHLLVISVCFASFRLAYNQYFPSWLTTSDENQYQRTNQKIQNISQNIGLFPE